MGSSSTFFSSFFGAFSFFGFFSWVPAGAETGWAATGSAGLLISGLLTAVLSFSSQALLEELVFPKS